MIEIKVPVLAESIPDATLLQWKVKPGEAVERDALLIEVETDKVVLEVLAPQAGAIVEIVRGDGETVVGDELIATFDTDGAAAAPAKGETAAQAPAPELAPSESPPAPSEARASAADELSPAARKLVAEHDLDATEIAGTGRGGRITKADVLEHLEKAPAPAEPDRAREPSPPPPPKPAPAPSKPGERTERRETMSRLRQRIAERLVQSQQNAAILTTFNELNMQPVMELRGRYKDAFEKKHGARLGFMSFFAKASVMALQRFPLVNAYVDGNDIVYHDYYDIGIAVGSPRGLVVPVLRDVDKLSFADIESQIGGFAARAQAGSLGIEELTGGTFTISNGGVFGSLLSTPIINPPQTAILGMHKTQQRPVAENGEVVVRPMMYLALSYDHRIIDGREAVQFLIAIVDALEDPGRMLLDV